jgi:hypothetical protein
MQGVSIAVLAPFIALLFYVQSCFCNNLAFVETAENAAVEAGLQLSASRQLRNPQVLHFRFVLCDGLHLHSCTYLHILSIE